MSDTICMQDRASNARVRVRRRFHSAAVALLFLGASLFSGGPAFATPSKTQLELENRQLKDEIAQINAELDDLVELYNEAAISLADSRTAIRKTEGELADAESAVSRYETALSNHVRVMYTLDSGTFLEVVLGARSLRELLSGAFLWQRLTGKDVELLSSASAARQTLRDLKVELEKRQEEEAAGVATLAERKAKIEARIADKQAAIARNRELYEAVTRAEARPAPAIRIASAQPVPSRGTARSANGGVVEVAMSLLGRPYRWGAAGPDSFDCSGFTMYVYSQVGISLPHSSSRQYGCGTRISRDQLLPGDLVFFARGSGRISHVGIFVGGDDFVHAPQTGEVVKVASLSAHGGYVGAVRP